jgi:hypothetical protein
MQRRSVSVLVASSALVGLTACGAAPTESPDETTTQAVTAVPSGVHAFANDRSGQCLAQGGVRPGEASPQAACDGGSEQSWRLQPDTNGAYTIVNVSSGLCLATREASADGDAWPAQSTCAGGSDQSWLPLSQSNGSYALVNMRRAQCLAVSEPPTAPPLVLRNCDGSQAQNWSLRTAATPPAAAPPQPARGASPGPSRRGEPGMCGSGRPVRGGCVPSGCGDRPWNPCPGPI